MPSSTATGAVYSLALGQRVTDSRAARFACCRCSASAAIRLGNNQGAVDDCTKVRLHALIGSLCLYPWLAAWSVIHPFQALQLNPDYTKAIAKRADALIALEKVRPSTLSELLSSSD